MWSYASKSNSIEEAIEVEFGNIDSFPIDKMISRFVDLSKQFYYVFPKTSEKIVSEAIQNNKNVLCDNYTTDLQMWFFGYEEEKLLKKLSENWENKTTLLNQVKSKCDSMIFYPHTHEKIPYNLKTKILTIVKNTIEHQQAAPSSNERSYLSFKIRKSIKDLILPYFKEKIDTVLTTFPIQQDGKRGGSHWSVILHTRWLKIILADIKSQSNMARNLEPFLIKTINRYGLDLFDFFSLENNEKMKIIESAEKERNEDLLRKDESGKREKIDWLKSVDSFNGLIQVLYEADYLESSNVDEIKSHFFFRDSNENVKCPAEHRIIIHGKQKNILYIFRELIRRKFIQRPVKKPKAKDDYSTVYIISEHFMKVNGELFNKSSLRSTNNQLERKEEEPDNSIFTKVVSKLEKLSNL